MGSSHASSHGRGGQLLFSGHHSSPGGGGWNPAGNLSHHRAAAEMPPGLLCVRRGHTLRCFPYGAGWRALRRTAHCGGSAAAAAAGAAGAAASPAALRAPSERQRAPRTWVWRRRSWRAASSWTRTSSAGPWSPSCPGRGRRRTRCPTGTRTTSTRT